MRGTAGEIVGRKRKSRVPVGEYLVIGELVRQGFSAKLAWFRERSLLVQASDGQHKSIRVKTAHGMPWYLRRSSFVRSPLDQVTVYVLLEFDHHTESARFFVVRNSDLANLFRESPTAQAFLFVDAKLLNKYEDKWDKIG